MGIKQAVKPFIPKSLLRYRWEVLQKRELNGHKKMNRDEIEKWLERSYFIGTGASLNLDNPRRFTEKIQWSKLNAMDKEKSMLADKYAVREWVANKIGEKHLIPLLGIWDDPDKIDFDTLPDSFVLKTNHASGTNIIVPRKRDLDIPKARRQLAKWLDLDFGWLGFEAQYLAIPKKVLAEKYVCNADGSEMNDYKVLCFDGKPRYIWVDIDRYSNHTRAFFDLEWNRLPWSFSYPAPPAEQVIEKPVVLDEMLSLAEILAAGFAHVRVDFYIKDREILFGEMTFSSESGFGRFEPQECDLLLGEMWDLSHEPDARFPEF